MKKTFTLCALAIATFTTNAQVVLNEVYTDPGATNNEFFEFYNSGTSQLAENLDNYTLVTYYEETGNKSGFYVLDMPNHTISAKNFYVGASASTFKVQGKNNLIASFAWNTIPAGGSLNKWEKNGAGYISVAVPANLNDFFVTRNGSGATQHIMIFKNGILINGLIGGGSSNTIPSYLKAMPSLFVDMSGSSPDFTINFGSISDNQVEYVTAVTGNDNGYIRTKDGKCGAWDKSTSQVTHTPGTSNGSAIGSTGNLTISSYITPAILPTDYSVLNYSISAGPADAFAVMVEAYRDFGIAGQLDAADILFYTNTVPAASSTVYSVNLVGKSDKVIFIAKSPAGCYDQLLALANASTLPVKLNNFQGSKNKSNVQLQWNVGLNEIANTFEVERSTNGKDFATAAILFGTEKTGNETYGYNEVNEDAKVYYRLKMVDKSDVLSYSKILVFNTNSKNTNKLDIIGNSVTDKLTVSFQSDINNAVELRILDMNGRMILKRSVTASKGSNLVSISLPTAMNTGLYIASVSSENINSTAKFIKQ